MLLCINHNCYLYMPSWGPDLVNKLIWFDIVLTVHLDFIQCMYKVILDFKSEAVASSSYDRSSFTVVTDYWPHIRRRWALFPITPGLFAAIFCNKFKYIGNIDFLLFNLFFSTHFKVFIQYSEWWTWFLSFIVFISALLIQRREECWWRAVQQKITNDNFINTTKNIE